ncbi:Serpin domain-containing protein [Desulfonema magnum]|uniref:Serpin domain-containing protein n=2 Tax=Desulfonema magnum TaxID=45655 RepID=A0A975BRA7_9BACT|nr:Serpin domain-containing protein [Desulfonema magnum]
MVMAQNIPEIEVQDSTLTMPLFLEQEKEIEGITLAIEYDKDVLDATGVTLAGGILENKDYTLIPINTDDEGKAKVSIYSGRELSPGSTETPFAFVDFKIIGRFGDSSLLSFEKFECNEMPVSGKSGFGVNETISDKVKVIVRSDKAENFNLTHAILVLKILAGMAEEGINSDINEDGKTGTEDAVYILRVIAGLTQPSDDQIEIMQSEKPRVTSPDVSADDLRDLVAGNTEFALALYQKLSENEGNLFYSPYSISQALAMTYSGAKNETEQQMKDTLHFLSQDRLHPAFNALDLELSTRGHGAEGQDGEGFRLNIANSIWGQTSYPFLSSFVDVLAENYGAGLNLLDFAKSPNDSRIAINEWVSDQTEEKIKDLIPPGAISSFTRLVLTNAIYFNAAWKFPFEEEATQNDTFYLADGTEMSVPMMSQTKPFGYAKGEGYEAVELLYDGDELSMVILLPDAPDTSGDSVTTSVTSFGSLFRRSSRDFGTFESSLTAEQLSTITESLELKNMQLKMPKFKYESDSVSLSETLAQMGMPIAFGDGADFSGMDGTRNLFISDVIHKAFVSVDEAGTEAAAATAVIMDESVPPEPIEVTINRPFIFLIRDIETKAILFIGRMVTIIDN